MDKICLADGNRQSVAECQRYMGRLAWTRRPLVEEVTCINCLTAREVELLGKVREANMVLAGFTKKLAEVRRRIHEVM